MKTTSIFVALAAVAALAAAAGRARYLPASGTAESSSVAIRGTSSLHEWTMEGTTIRGAVDVAPEVAADPANPAAWKSEKPALVTVTIPVSAIRSGHTRMNNIMLDAMKAKSFPEIRYELASAVPAGGSGESFTMRTSGKLTIAGVTRELQMDVRAASHGRQVVLAGEAPIRMTDYGIKPPVAMMGTLKTGDAVKVAFRWVVDRTE
jgi:polyisoprenoid-binding protein YceI